MADTKINFEAAKAKAEGNAARTREQSTIANPNVDLSLAIDVARAVYARQGLGSCPLDELAAEMKCTMSGTFRIRTAAAQVFGFIQKDGRSAVKLTDLGCHLVTPESEAEAKATAFLNVPLYSRIYENYRGKLLPPTKALEREMTNLGVALKQATAARQIFQRSARQSGFFGSGEDRLVRPKTTGTLGSTEPSTIEQATFDESLREDSDHRRGGGNGSGGSRGRASNLHPFIQGLLDTLPEPETNWAIEGQAKWLQAAANIFCLMYKGTGEITLKAVEKNGATET